MTTNREEVEESAAGPEVPKLLDTEKPARLPLIRTGAICAPPPPPPPEFLRLPLPVRRGRPDGWVCRRCTEWWEWHPYRPPTEQELDIPCVECRKTMEPEERAVEVNRHLLARLNAGSGFLALPVPTIISSPGPPAAQGQLRSVVDEGGCLSPGRGPGVHPGGVDLHRPHQGGGSRRARAYPPGGGRARHQRGAPRTQRAAAPQGSPGSEGGHVQALGVAREGDTQAEVLTLPPCTRGMHMPPEPSYIPVPVLAAILGALAAALVGALGTLLVQGRLEQQRLRNALAVEITRAHIEALKRVFAAVYQVDAATNLFEERLLSSQSIHGAGNEFGKRLSELRQVVAQERFPLGPRIFEVARNLAYEYDHFIDDYAGIEKYPEAGKKITALKQELHALAPDLDLVPKSMLAKLTPKERQLSNRALASGNQKKRDT